MDHVQGRSHSVANILEVYENSQIKVTILIILVILSFYISWTPYAICSLLAMAGNTVHRTATVISILCAKSGTIFIPILYILFIGDVNMRVYNIVFGCNRNNIFDISINTNSNFKVI